MLTLILWSLGLEDDHHLLIVHFKDRKKLRNVSVFNTSQFYKLLRFFIKNTE